MGSWWDDMGDTWLFKSAKSVGRHGAKAVQYGAVPVGSIFFGPLGGLVATPIAAAAGQVGPTKNAGAQLKRDLVSSAAVVGGTAGLGLLSGAGVGASVLQSFSALFGLGPAAPKPPAAQPMSDTDLYKHYFKTPAQQSAAGSLQNTALDLAGKLIGGTQANPANLNQQYLDQLALAEKHRAAGDQAAARDAAALAEVYRQQLMAQGQAVPSAGLPIGVLLLVAGGAWLLLRKK